LAGFNPRNTAISTEEASEISGLDLSRRNKNGLRNALPGRVLSRHSQRGEEFANGRTADAELLGAISLRTARRARKYFAQHHLVVINEAVGDVVASVDPDSAVIGHAAIA